MRILAVDDDPIILELLGQFVEIIGTHELLTADSALDALEALADPDIGHIDCFMFDIQMPGMDGIDLTKRIRETARYSDTPILMLTAMSDKRYIDAAFAAGASDYVTKPFEIAELTSRIKIVENAAQGKQQRTKKIFAAKSVADQSKHVELFEPISIYDVDNVIEYTAMENYVAQLSRSALFGSTTFAFTIREIDAFHASLSAFEFYSLVSDVAEVLSDTLIGHQFLMSYAGNGTFVCITESGWRPDMAALMDAVNFELSQTELFDNHGTRVHPRVSAGNAVRLIWKHGSSVMDALADAHSSAEAASLAHTKSLTNFWQVDQRA
ncbi:response regulator [Sulfitobacter sp. S0837]|uniref:response regulator n=1 Tax=Sulfitobacter maritimus TaxID=2741719 RepID=UPI001582ECD7|nr:response regulator [Sulfitobacter maritimus]NUH66819.1 response regulator [Sulfitobacter maritimus]